MLKKVKKFFGQPNGAEEKRAPLGDPGSFPEQPKVKALREQAQQLFAEKKFAESLKVVEQGIAVASNQPGLNHLRGMCLNHVGRHQEAFDAFGRELEIDSQNTEARQFHDSLAKALAKRVVKKIPTMERSYKTSLPVEVLHSIQPALHDYKYRGVPMLKNPFDMSLYPVLLWELKPKTIFEIGSKSGGSALWFGDMLNNFGIDGHIYSGDIVKVTEVSHPRVTFMEANGRALEKTFTPEFLKNLPRPWLVIEDADHAYETSIATLNFFHQWLKPGEYIVVEDGIISDLERDAACNSGPHRALKEFLPQHLREYEIDANYCDFFGYNTTWCTNGFLKRLDPNAK